MENDNNNQMTADTSHDDHDGKLAAEAARRRVQAREAAERADAAEAEAADLRAQIAALKLSQAKQAVTARHPELTPELLERYAPDNVDADSLDDWADKAMGLVVELRGEATVDADAMTDTERELAAAQMELARSKAVSANPHVTGEVLDALCTADTPEEVEAWAATFERVCGPLMKPAKRELSAGEKLVNQAADAAHGGGTWVGSKRGLQSVAQQLTKR
ncbi:hypothetical protein [Bifidobacterium pseudolongum]|uniref:hypothetical protein n=1 Tax=Bifidobacterium pseudolongum TaxID=1694 RepID=UPI001021AC7D|nr:hypothetical protein [Bifidobacterium pseudolongum]RYQ03605.1 hypothetical protein PG22511B_0096 [Bifidobacterium pseudolongum subsp. globosum]